jgi:hypothetical protein
MRRARALATIAAMLGVLLNVGFVVRHMASSLEARFEHAALRAALGIMCNGNGQAALPAGERSDIPPISPKSSDCPVCMGMSPAAAVLADATVLLPVLNSSSARPNAIGEVVRTRAAGLRPPPRGPPQSA